MPVFAKISVPTIYLSPPVIKKFLFAFCLLVLCASVTVAMTQAVVALTAASPSSIPIATLVWPLWFFVCAAFFRSRLLLLLGSISLVISLLVLAGLIF